MSKKITKAEYIDNIRNIINEGMSDAPDYNATDRFNVSRYVAGLIEEGHQNPKLMDFLMKWDKTLEHVEEDKEYLVFRQFTEGLNAFAAGNLTVKKVMDELSNLLAEYGGQLDVFCYINTINDIDARIAIHDAYNEYLFEGTPDAHADLIDALYPVYTANDPAAIRIMELIADEDAGNREVGTYLTEQAHMYNDINKRIAKQREEKKVKRVQEKLEAYANSLFENAKAERATEKEKYSFANLVNNNGIGLSEAIKSIASSDAKSNRKLMETIEQYAGALNHGLYEERLYDTFVHKMKAYDYLVPVENAIRTINENVKKNSISIEITKLLEEMSESASYQILPLIEEDCARYAKNPTPNNRVQLRQALMPFANDPYCYKIMETVDRDSSKEANTLSERALNVKDTVKLIREKAVTSALYSPVQYIKEGECVFNVNGTYFVKKNNSISKLGMEHVNQLSEKFTSLCQLVNDPAVTINDDEIILEGYDKVAYIHEGYVDINGCRESQSTLRNLQEMCVKYDFDTNFFIMCSCLLENFNNIAKINFGTHIALKENAGINVDMFRLGENIFIHAVNEHAQQSTFFHNVNPMQCKNIINGHMGLNVSAMFEDLLPAQDKIIMKLNETKEAYIESIEKLDNMISKAEAAKKKCSDSASIKKLEDTIEKAKKLREETKEDYKKWQKQVEEETGEDMHDGDEPDDSEDEINGDGETRTETTAEPLDDKDVDTNIDELSTPIEGTEAAEGDDPVENNDDTLSLTDDEFESFLKDNGDIMDDDAAEVEPDIESEDGTSDNADETEVEDFNDAVEDTEPVDEPIADTAENADEVEPSDVDDVESTGTSIADIVDDVIDDTDSGEDEVITPEIGFNEVPVDDEINIDTPAADITSDEDILIGDESVDDNVADEPTDMFGGNPNDPLGDTEHTPVVSGEDIEVIKTVERESTITNILFDENIKTGQKFRTGTVTVITPMVSADGRLYNKTDEYSFYLDAEGNPVIQGDDMSGKLYNAIIDTIKADSLYDVFVKEGVDSVDSDKLPAETEPTPITVTVDNDHIADDDEDSIPNDFFNTNDMEDSFSVEFNDDFDDASADESVATAVEEPVTPATPADAPYIPTYKSGETEIELPAPDVDGSVIPESAAPEAGKKSVNENRRAIKGIKAGIKTASGVRFFVNEDTVKSSSEMNRSANVASVTEKFDGVDNCDNGSMIENYDETADTDNINVIREFMCGLCKRVAHNSGDMFDVSEIGTYFNDPESIAFYKPYYFNVRTLNNTDTVNSFTVYQVESGNIYYRPTEEFNSILTDLEDEVPGQTTAALETEYYDDKELEPFHMEDTDDWQFMAGAVIQGLSGTNISNELNEHCKIRKTKLSSGHNFLDSKLADDIQHGDKDERDFKDDVEKNTQAAGVENPLAPSSPPQEEAYVPQLPNAHRQVNISEMMETYDFVFEANDHVLYNKAKAHIIEVSSDGLIANIMTEDGSTIKVETKDLEPDPEYINDLNIINTDTELSPLDKKESGGKLKDLDAKMVDCNIVVDGHRMNTNECHAYLQDIIDSKKNIRVIDESDEIREYSIEDNLEFPEWPYAVVINASGEPVRKIQIDPQSYVASGDDDLVNCICGGKQTEFPKRSINILS